MKRWRKWVNAIFAIALLLTIFCAYFLVYDYGDVTATLGSYKTQSWFYYCFTVLAIISALFALIIFIRAIALPTINNYVIDKDKSGEMLLTSHAIENNVISTVNKYPEIRNSKADVKVNNGKGHEITAKVICGIYDGENINSLGEIIKNDVKESLEVFTGYPVNKVDVEFYDIKKDSNKRVV